MNFVGFFFINFKLTSIKQTTLNKKISFHKNEFAKSLAMYAMRARVVYMSMCQHANVPTSHFTCQRANVPKACQFSTWRTNVPKGLPIFQLRLPKGVSNFQLFFKRIFKFLNFSILPNICKFQEHLGSSRKLISQKEFKLYICKIKSFVVKVLKVLSKICKLLL